MIKSRLSQIKKASQSRQLAKALQEERSAVWGMYCKIAAMKPDFASTEKVRPLLSRFSQLLIDYIALGHFGIYEHLLTEKQQQFTVLSYAIELYPAFSSTTAAAISFNDAYADGRHNFNCKNLAADLSKLGEQLAKRMELEDRLCFMLLDNHYLPAVAEDMPDSERLAPLLNKSFKRSKAVCRVFSITT